MPAAAGRPKPQGGDPGRWLRAASPGGAAPAGGTQPPPTPPHLLLFPHPGVPLTSAPLRQALHAGPPLGRPEPLLRNPLGAESRGGGSPHGRPPAQPGSLRRRARRGAAGPPAGRARRARHRPGGGEEGGAGQGCDPPPRDESPGCPRCSLSAGRSREQERARAHAAPLALAGGHTPPLARRDTRPSHTHTRAHPPAAIPSRQASQAPLAGRWRRLGPRPGTATGLVPPESGPIAAGTDEGGRPARPHPAKMYRVAWVGRDLKDHRPLP